MNSQYSEQRQQVSSSASTPYKNAYYEVEVNNSISEDEQIINQLLKGLKNKYVMLDNLLQSKEEEKIQIIHDINVLNQRMNALVKSIDRKKIAYQNYDKTLVDAESAFSKITESTKTLLQVVKKETGQINKLVQNKYQQ